jgi:hypothetical protein
MIYRNQDATAGSHDVHVGGGGPGPGLEVSARFGSLTKLVSGQCRIRINGCSVSWPGEVRSLTAASLVACHKKKVSCVLPNRPRLWNPATQFQLLAAQLCVHLNQCGHYLFTLSTQRLL